MVKKKRSNTNDEDSSLVDPTSRSFIYDEVDDYNNIDLDEDDNQEQLEYGHGTKLISNNKRKEHILGLDLDSSDDDNDDDDDGNDSFNDDIPSSEDEDAVPKENVRSMGKWKKDYFGTDITDQRLHNDGKIKKNKREEKALGIELQLALETQKRLGKEKEAFQFFIEDELNEKSTKEKEGDNSEKLKKLKKLQKSRKDADVEADLQEKCDELTTFLSPLINALKKGLLPSGPAVEYLKTRYYLCLNFLNNVAAKKMLIRSGDDISMHPVEKRLVQYRQMYKELDLCKAQYEAELHKLLEDFSSGKLRKQNRKMLGILKDKKSQEEELQSEEEIEKDDVAEGESDEEIEDQTKDTAEFYSEAVEGKRFITHEIEKNKGLMPSRKKDQRNPRVKYKKKYQNKLKRRKGQVREVRRELTRYAGETSGIKTTVIKSIKFK